MNINVKEFSELLERVSRFDSPFADECRQAADKLRRGQLDLIFFNPETQEQVNWAISSLVGSGTPIADSGEDLELWVEEEAD